MGRLVEHRLPQHGPAFVSPLVRVERDNPCTGPNARSGIKGPVRAAWCERLLWILAPRTGTDEHEPAVCRTPARARPSSVDYLAVERHCRAKPAFSIRVIEIGVHMCALQNYGDSGRLLVVELEGVHLVTHLVAQIFQATAPSPATVISRTYSAPHSIRVAVSTAAIHAFVLFMHRAGRHRGGSAGERMCDATVRRGAERLSPACTRHPNRDRWFPGPSMRAAWCRLPVLSALAAGARPSGRSRDG